MITVFKDFKYTCIAKMKRENALEFYLNNIST